MANIALSAVADVRPLPGAIVRRYTAGGALTVGDTVYMAADGDVEEADANAVGTTYAIGIVVSIAKGGTTAVAGDAVDVARYGPVAGFTGATPHDVVYQSNDAGLLEDAAGANSHKMGRMESATVVFLQPELTEA